MNWLRQKRKVEALNQQLVQKRVIHQAVGQKLQQSATAVLSGSGARIWAFSAGLAYGLARTSGSSTMGLGAVATLVRSSLFFVRLAGPRS